MQGAQHPASHCLALAPLSAQDQTSIAGLKRQERPGQQPLLACDGWQGACATAAPGMPLPPEPTRMVCEPQRGEGTLGRKKRMAGKQEGAMTALSVVEESPRAQRSTQGEGVLKAP